MSVLVTLDPTALDGAVFDLDGVLASTARLHERAWSETVGAALRERGDERPFGREDYLRHVDGRLRLDGARGALRARGIEDEALAEAVAHRKNTAFLALLEREGAEALPGAAALLAALRAAGLRTGLFTASRNARRVLSSVGLAEGFDAWVDGEVAAERGLRGKPASDTPLACARLMGVAPERCALFEDAVAGVEAGVAGGFRPVVGIAPPDEAARLLAAGARAVVPSLAAVALGPDAGGGPGGERDPEAPARGPGASAA